MSRTDRLLSFYTPGTAKINPQLFCCVCIQCRGNVLIEKLLSKDTPTNGRDIMKNAVQIGSGFITTGSGIQALVRSFQRHTGWKFHAPLSCHLKIMKAG
jgi:hypothetical protein